MTDNFRVLESIRFDKHRWTFSDFRIDIPPMSSGSDAANPHTQYSNAVASFMDIETFGIGACFTLGEGNQFICEAAEFIIKNLHGVKVKELLNSSIGLADALANPLQLRWLSPNAGVPLMSAGLILNTIIDLASKKLCMPAWKFLAGLDIEELMKLVSWRHISNLDQIVSQLKENSLGDAQLAERFAELELNGIPAYFTTWIGSDAPSLREEIQKTYEETGIRNFKIKIGFDIATEMEKIDNVIHGLSDNFIFSADANQRLQVGEAIEWMNFLSDRKFSWLEEPFAPDNVLLFRELVELRKHHHWSCEIATGENCPNLHTAQALLSLGIDRFQADPCRMLGIADAVFSGVLSDFYGAQYSPHAGGAGLDELSPHLQFFHLARVDTRRDVDQSLTETIGFASKFYASPTIIENGRIRPPSAPGLLVGFSEEVATKLIPFREGVTWVKP
jgi:L-alanine-DL-glutamate epimerase-like enolase superfamily enzyme